MPVRRTKYRFEHFLGQDSAEGREPLIVGGSEVKIHLLRRGPIRKPQRRRRLAVAWAGPAPRTMRTTASGPHPGRGDCASPTRSVRSRGVGPPKAPSRFAGRRGHGPLAAEANGGQSSRKPADPGAPAEHPMSSPNPRPSELQTPPWPKATPASRRQSILATPKPSLCSCGSTNARRAPLHVPSYSHTYHAGRRKRTSSRAVAYFRRRALPRLAGYVLRLRETRDNTQLHEPTANLQDGLPETPAYRSSLLPEKNYLGRKKRVPVQLDFPPIRARSNAGSVLLPTSEGSEIQQHARE